MFRDKDPFTTRNARCCSFRCQCLDLLLAHKIRSPTRCDLIESNTEKCVPHNPIGHDIVIELQTGDTKSTNSCSAGTHSKLGCIVRVGSLIKDRLTIAKSQIEFQRCNMSKSQWQTSSQTQYRPYLGHSAYRFLSKYIFPSFAIGNSRSRLFYLDAKRY